MIDNGTIHFYNKDSGIQPLDLSTVVWMGVLLCTMYVHPTARNV